MKKERIAKKLIKQGLIISAIREIRNANGIGLGEAKDACEKWQEEMGRRPKIRPLHVRYETPPPKPDIVWLETKHFAAPEREIVLLAWPRTEGFTFRTGRRIGDTWLLTGDVKPREKPTFFAQLN